MPLYTLRRPALESAPLLIAAFDSWIDAGGASSTAADLLAGDGETIADFDGDVLFDYRSRRPTLQIVDGRLAELTWPSLRIRHRRLRGRDLLVLSGAEPDFHWHQLADGVGGIVTALNVRLWISLGAIPAAVPHTRPVPVLGSSSKADLLLGDVRPGPAGTLRVPSAAISMLEHAIGGFGIPAIGYYAQVPHYLTGPYPAAAIALVRAVGWHLGFEIPTPGLHKEAHALRERIDLATGDDEASRAYVERLETMVDEERLPSGDDLISEIERFLHDRGNEDSERA
jgi:hypothetical protein